LAEKIAKSQAYLTSLQQSSRRTRTIWTLYSSFAYLLCFIILFLVVGWRNWTALEYTAVSGSPLIIWAIRTVITWSYTWRIDRATQSLEIQQAERTKTIEKLKAATRYDSTQELLEKYGGEKARPKVKKDLSSGTTARTPKNVQKIPPGRTSIGPPPPTANIRGPVQFPSQPSTPQPNSRSPSTYQTSSPISSSGPIVQAEFAPNAFSAPPQFAHQNEFESGGHWYDRLLDLLMGEDETLSKNRLVLICPNCRLVNGQAPPGTKTLAELGKWRCFGCGSLNGEDDEVKELVHEAKRLQSGKETPELSSDGKDTKDIEAPAEVADSEEDDIEVVENETQEKPAEDSADDSVSDMIEVATTPKRGPGRPKGSRKKT